MRQLNELESLLQRMHEQYLVLAEEIAQQQTAIKTSDLELMGESARKQESIRMRIGAMETRRKHLVAELGRLHRVEGEMTISMLAELHPDRGPQLLTLRDQLKATVQGLHEQVSISARVAGAVLGHLNTAVRIIATAAQSAGLYTKYGIPQAATTLGVVEAVG
jgi:hypothetical protein